MTISVSQARTLCTKAELDLVVSSTPRHIGKLDVKQLRSAIRRTRTMRDKWRDLGEQQIRGTKTNDPGNLDRANARSAEKLQLFNETLARYETRLERVGAGGKQTAAGGSAATRTPKQVRAKGHRASRAEIRDQLNAKTDKLNKQPQSATKKKATAKTGSSATKKTATKKTATKKTATKKTATKKQAVEAATKPAKKSAATKRPVVKRLRVTDTDVNSSIAKPAGQPDPGIGKKRSVPATGAEKKRNRKATTAAKAVRVSRSGAPKIQAHISSQGKRNQARRNTR